MENSVLFKSSKAGQGKKEAGGSAKASQNLAQVTRSAKAGKAGGISNPEDLLTAEDDLAIDQNNMLEQYTLQKITMQWLTWNAQFFNCAGTHLIGEGRVAAEHLDFVAL